MLKMHCILCKEPRELTVEELKETAKFVRNNELDSDGYEDFMSTKVGKKCKGIDNRAEKLKKHKYMIDEEDLKTIGETANKIKSDIEKHTKYTSRVLDIENSIAELVNEKTKIQEKLPAIETLIKDDKEKLVSLVEDDREGLWI